MPACIDALFPVSTLPDDPRVARLVGVYPQVQEGLWMQRVRVLGGALTAAQWRALARLVRSVTPGSPLHLTTRQDVEFHDLTAEDVPCVQAVLAEAGLTALGAGGDTVRNITVCPCCCGAAGAVDLLPLARLMQAALEAEEGILTLPRKFKVSLSACEAGCGAPFINDLGFTAVRIAGVPPACGAGQMPAARGAWGLRVAAGGSLGARPLAGLVIFDHLDPADAIPCAVAAVRVLQAFGDREDRRHARLRHVRERLGDETFKTILQGTFDLARQGHEWPTVDLAQTAPAIDALLTLTFPNGDVTPEAAEALAHLADREDLRVRISHYHRVIVFGNKGTGSICPALEAAARPQPAIVACPGTRWCRHALADTNGLADRLRRELSGRLAPETTVCISGCPNNCAHSAAAPIGLVGGQAARDGRRSESWTLLLGGDLGRSPRLAAPAASRLSADQVVAALASRAKAGEAHHPRA